jgi:hypothetical protein
MVNDLKKSCPSNEYIIHLYCHQKVFLIFLLHYRIQFIQLISTKKRSDTAMSASYSDLHKKTNDIEGQLKTKEQTTCNKIDIKFPIMEFPFICSNIPTAPAYGVYIQTCISQLMQYFRAKGFY